MADECRASKRTEDLMLSLARSGMLFRIEKRRITTGLLKKALRETS